MSEESYAEEKRINAARVAAEQRERTRNSVFELKEDPNTPYTPTAAVGDDRLRHDTIENALKLGSFPVKDQAGNQIGWTNQRLDLLLAAEKRRLLDTFDHSPSREETLVHMINHHTKGLTPGQKYELALNDKNCDPSVLKALIMGSSVSKPVDKPAPKIVPMTSKAATEAPTHWAQPEQETAQWATFTQLPVNPPSPRVPVSPDKNIALQTPMGKINLSVLDVVQEPEQGFAVIVQREDAPFVFLPPRSKDQYIIDGIPRPVTFSGISFAYNGTRSTVMVIN